MMGSTLPLSRRLRRAALVALILGLWAPLKIAWEQKISHEQDALRYHGVTVSRELRDQLGQGLTIGILSGMRNVVADFIWIINVTLAWENEEWFRMNGLINLCTSLQPRSVTFWDVGGWQLAWNASVAATENLKEPNELRRLRASRFWVEKGIDVYKRGIENNPQSWKLLAHTGLLYQQRMRDYRSAASYYQRTAELPDAPVFYERFPALMYGMAGDDQAAYAAWQALWNRLSPQQRAQMEHTPTPSDLAKIRRLEQKLSVPKEKRIFPN